MTIRLEKTASDLSYIFGIFPEYHEPLFKATERRPKKRQDDKLRVDIGKKEKACAVTKALDV